MLKKKQAPKTVLIYIIISYNIYVDLFYTNKDDSTSWLGHQDTRQLLLNIIIMIIKKGTIFTYKHVNLKKKKERKKKKQKKTGKTHKNLKQIKFC